jgi:brefeldin A-inhibited guanine nucleotide-exchange protein
MLAVLDEPSGPGKNAITLFQPFQIACRSGNPELLTVAIDCLGKLFSYNYWKTAQGIHVEPSKAKKQTAEDDNDNDGTEEMISFVVDTICDG